MDLEYIINNQSLAHLGITATHVRRVKSGAEYEKYFDKPTGITNVINEEATVHDTHEFVALLVNQTLNDTKKIAKELKRTTLDATCRAVFDFFYQNYQYKLDQYGVEEVRTPARAWADRKTGIDCDCFTASVSSVLTNLGIEHYLKIIAINNKPDFQHIYVVVPKRQGLDINSRANYWVVDPVLNHYDEEAPKITQTKHLKMNGIPLHQLNGIEELAGLGNEFEGIDEELNGLDEESIGRVFHRRLKQHVTNTRRKIEQNPNAVAHIYKPDVLLAQVQKLETAMDGTESYLDGVLEELSNTEHKAMQSRFLGSYDAIHGHDDHLYGVMFGDIDDNMLGAVLGLGRKGRSDSKTKSASKKGKKGFFTKVKNARKIVKSGKLKSKVKGSIKKIGRLLKKTNPIAIAARAGFIMAMRTNFAKIAEKAYWGFQTREFAMSKGIKADYYDACVKIKEKLLQVFVKTLGGDEGTLKKPIMNGRAAKKIAKLLKAKGMSGTTEELFGLGGFGSAAASATTITAAMAFLAPIIKMIKDNKAKKSGLEKDEKGKPSEDINDDGAIEMDTTQSEARNGSDSTIIDDGSIEAADNANDEDNMDENSSKKKKDNTSVKTVSTSNIKVAANKLNNEETQNNDAPEGSLKGKIGLILGLSALGIGAIALMAKKKTPLSGLDGFSKKRESKNLQEKLKKQGIKMPHGYKVEKRIKKKIKTIKI